ncbi:sensor histidine kinase [Nitrococcus mobilis]|uniref:sensor histidine kinase n=1 Tax=Nitrococcus mobilis TaxID=35797 RepID=UPI0003266127|nr:PAS domain S-box protein [Nitrococcus mobilis]
MAQQHGSQPPRIGSTVEGHLTEAILSASVEILWVFDRESRYRYVSPYAASLLQLDPAAMIGRSWRELGFPAEFMVPFEENLRCVFRENKTLRGETPFLIRDERRHFEYVLTPLETTDAGMELVIANAWDVTDRERMGESLHRSERLFRSLLKAAPSAILLIDAAGTITLANEQAEVVFGFPHDELIGMRIETLMPERFRSRHVGYRETYQTNPVTRPMGAGRELYARHKNGAEFPVDISLSPLETDAGLLTISIARDITDRIATTNTIRKLNRTLEHKVTQLSVINQELEAFCYSVSHDLRAPLRGLDGFSQALLEDYAETLDETGQDYLRRIRAASQRMAQLIDDLLRLSRITRAEITLDTVDLTGIANEIIAERRAQAPHRQVMTHIAPRLSVEGDRRLLRVALENLLDNAWKFTAGKPQAEIELGIDAADRATPTYYVRDNGAGFDMAYAERLFGPFQRLHSPQEFEGHGIGLATVQRIIQRHGGCIWANAEPQRGAIFCFTLADPDFHGKR